MANPRSGFIPDTQTLITEFLKIADAWSALQQEFSTFGTNQVVITQAHLDAAGLPDVTPAAYSGAGGILATMQTIVDSIHTDPAKSKLYRMRR